MLNFKKFRIKNRKLVEEDQKQATTELSKNILQELRNSHDHIKFMSGKILLNSMRFSGKKTIFNVF